MRKPINIIPYFGGKSKHYNFISHAFPKAKHFIDAMCGSAAVAINADFDLITINDLNGDVINFYKTLVSSIDEFMELLYLTPFSREVFDGNFFDLNNEIHRAVYFYVRSLQGYGASNNQNNHKGWGVDINPKIKSKHFRVHSWNSKPKHLQKIVSKLRTFQIENLSVFEILDKFDYTSNFIYIDPPYILSTRNKTKRYRFEWDDSHHSKLLEAVQNVKCSLMISGYESDLYEKHLKKSEWIKVRRPSFKGNVYRKGTSECIWINYQPPSIQTTLFN